MKVWGSTDELEVGRLFEKALPGSELVEVPRATHETVTCYFSKLLLPVLAWLNINEPGRR